MKYYPRLKIFKDSKGNNTFDGFEARSYSWYVYAYVIGEKIYYNSYHYSSTTNRQQSNFRALIRNTDTINIEAPHGLNNHQSARRWIENQIKRYQDELANKRNRNLEYRRDLLKRYQEMIPLLDQMEVDLKLKEA